MVAAADLPRRPELLPGLQGVLDAFWRLSSDRPVFTDFVTIPAGGAIGRSRSGAIPFTAIDAYARRYGIVDEEFELLMILVSACDSEWLAVSAERTRADG